VTSSLPLSGKAPADRGVCNIPCQSPLPRPDSKTRPFAQRLQKALGGVSSLRDLQFEQELDYPAVKVDIDRQLAGMLGVTANQVGQSLTEATSSSRFTVPNFWADPKSDVGYQVQVEMPPLRMNSLEEVKNIPVSRSQVVQIDLRNVAEVTQGTVLGEYDRDVNAEVKVGQRGVAKPGHFCG
jgi:multidrug efflux pump subunit AcrB